MTGLEPFIIAAMIAGGGMQVYSTIQQGKAAEAQGKAQEKIAQYNAELADREAKARMEASQMEEQRVSRQQKIFGAQQRASFAKSGISLMGTPLDVLVDSAEQFNQDRLLTLRSGLLQKNQLEAQADITRVEGKWAKTMGKAAKRQSYFTAAGQGLSTVGSVGMYSKLSSLNATSAGGSTASGYSAPYSQGFKQSIGNMNFQSPYLPAF